MFSFGKPGVGNSGLWRKEVNQDIQTTIVRVMKNDGDELHLFYARQGSKLLTYINI